MYNLNSSLKFNLVLKYYYSNYKIKCNTSITNQFHRLIFFRFLTSYYITNSCKFFFFGIKNIFLCFKIFKHITRQTIKVFFTMITKLFKDTFFLLSILG